MKTLEFNQMESVQGGSWLSGFCIGYSGGGAIAILAGISVTGIGALIAGGLAAGCVAYAISQED